MKKIIKNPIFTFILGAIIFTNISVFAVTKIQANEVVFNDTNVENALDYLYDNYTQSKSISLHPTVSPVYIELGFQPKNISCITYLKSTEVYVNIIYNSNYDSEHVYRITSAKDMDSVSSATTLTSKAQTNIPKWFTIDDNGFS